MEARQGFGEQLDSMMRGFHDLRRVLQQPSPQKVSRGSARTSHSLKKPTLAPHTKMIIPPTSFQEAWKAYCSTNARLRDPKALPNLMRQGVPEELREDVWTHCLGIEKGSVVEACWQTTSGPTPAELVPISATLDAQNGPTADPTMVTTPAVQAAESHASSAADGRGAYSHHEVLVLVRTMVYRFAAQREISAAELRVEKTFDAGDDGLVSACASGDELHDISAEEDWMASPAESERVEVEFAENDVQESTGETALHVAEGETAESLPQNIIDIIEADVSRTFPNCAAFKSAGGANQLRRVLQGLARRDTELGYCQSLNFVAAVWIMVVHDERRALLGVQHLLTKLGSRSWYMDGMQQLRADTAVLEDIVRERLPGVHAAFRKTGFDLLFVSSKWFLCLFTTCLEGETLRRVWDVMLCDGIEAVFRVALALLAVRSDAILKAQSSDDLVIMFQEWRDDDTSPETIMQSAYPSLGWPLSRAELAQRRRQALLKVSTEDKRTEMRTQRLWRGGVRPASILSR